MVRPIPRSSRDQARRRHQAWTSATAMASSVSGVPAAIRVGSLAYPLIQAAELPGPSSRNVHAVVGQVKVK